MMNWRIGSRACWCCGAKWRSGCVIGPDCQCDGTPIDKMCLRCGRCPEHCQCTPIELRALAKIIEAAGDEALAKIIEAAGDDSLRQLSLILKETEREFAQKAEEVQIRKIEEN